MSRRMPLAKSRSGTILRSVTSVRASIPMRERNLGDGSATSRAMAAPTTSGVGAFAASSAARRSIVSFRGA